MIKAAIWLGIPALMALQGCTAPKPPEQGNAGVPQWMISQILGEDTSEVAEVFLSYGGVVMDSNKEFSINGVPVGKSRIGYSRVVLLPGQHVLSATLRGSTIQQRIEVRAGEEYYYRLEESYPMGKPVEFDQLDGRQAFRSFNNTQRDEYMLVLSSPRHHFLPPDKRSNAEKCLVNISSENCASLLKDVPVVMISSPTEVRERLIAIRDGRNVVVDTTSITPAQPPEAANIQSSKQQSSDPRLFKLDNVDELTQREIGYIREKGAERYTYESHCGSETLFSLDFGIGAYKSSNISASVEVTDGKASRLIIKGDYSDPNAGWFGISKFKLQLVLNGFSGEGIYGLTRKNMPLTQPEALRIGNHGIFIDHKNRTVAATANVPDEGNFVKIMRWDDTTVSGTYRFFGTENGMPWYNDIDRSKVGSYLGVFCNVPIR